MMRMGYEITVSQNHFYFCIENQIYRDDTGTVKTLLKEATGHIRSFRSDDACDDPDFRKVLGAEVHQIIPHPKDAVIRKYPLKRILISGIRQ